MRIYNILQKIQDVNIKSRSLNYINMREEFKKECHRCGNTYDLEKYVYCPKCQDILDDEEDLFFLNEDYETEIDNEKDFPEEK